MMKYIHLILSLNNSLFCILIKVMYTTSTSYTSIGTYPSDFESEQRFIFIKVIYTTSMS